MNIVLVEPEIPQNTGNIARTCVLTGSTLHLVEPLGFSLQDRYLKRAGLDYWPSLDLKIYKSFKEFEESNKDANFLFFSTKARTLYTPLPYSLDDYLIFGSETKGLSPEILKKYQDRLFRVPMKKGIKRSLNLSNTVALVLYEALRVNNFPGME
ncbi:MAG: tRNA (cytidine(34)-2'-O)-methyltransferase [Firmicutes bacterium]|nr:tRNA (cytidine(34)-2'-O)-methyltransferase [Bacillota bacterium]